MSSNKGPHEDTKKSREEGQPIVPSTEIEFVAMGEKPPKGRARYRDPENPFNTWGGRGKRPEWLRKYLDNDRTLTEFEIAED